MAGVLGIWVVVLAFLGFSDSLHQLLLIVTGLAIAISGFWPRKIVKPADELIKMSRQLNPEQVQQQQQSVEQKPS